MSRKAIFGLFAIASFAFAGDKGKAQAPTNDQKAQAPAAKAQSPSKGETQPFSRIVTETTIVREYAPVQRHKRLFFRQVGPSKVTTSCTECAK